MSSRSITGSLPDASKENYGLGAIPKQMKTQHKANINRVALSEIQDSCRSIKSQQTDLNLSEERNTTDGKIRTRCSAPSNQQRHETGVTLKPSLKSLSPAISGCKRNLFKSKHRTVTAGTRKNPTRPTRNESHPKTERPLNAKKGNENTYGLNDSNIYQDDVCEATGKKDTPNFEHLYTHRKVTYTRGIHSYDSRELDEAFVDASSFNFEEAEKIYKPTPVYSPVLMPVPVRRSGSFSSKSKSVQKPAEKTRLIKKLKQRNSSSLKNTPNFEHLYTHGKVTCTRGIHSYDSSELDEAFVDASSFNFEEAEKSNKPAPVYSPVLMPVPVRRSGSFSSKSKLVQKPAEKTTLIKKLQQRNGSSLKKRYSINIFTEEYLEDIILHLSNKENQILLQKDEVEKYVDTEFRAHVVNWLMQLAEVIGISASDSIFYVAVKIFDYTLVSLKIRRSYYMLVAIAAYWLTLKYYCNQTVLQSSKLFALCEGKYSKLEIITMERIILRTIDFDMNIPDPLDFLNFYMKHNNLEKNELLEVYSRFTLDCFTLYKEFTTTKSSISSAAALSISYNMVTGRNDLFLENKLPNWINKTILRLVADAMVCQIKIVVGSSEVNEPIKKYMTAENLFVTKTIDLSTFDCYK